MGWARAPPSKARTHPDHPPEGGTPMNGQPINLAHPNPTGTGKASPTRHASSAPPGLSSPPGTWSRPLTGSSPDYGVPADTQNPYGKRTVQDREAALALGTPGGRRRQPRERPQPSHVAGRPGLPCRRRHPHRPPPTRPPAARPRSGWAPNANPPGTASSKEHSRWLQTTRPPSPATSSRPLNSASPTPAPRSQPPGRRHPTHPAGRRVARRRDLLLQGQRLARPS